MKKYRYGLFVVLVSMQLGVLAGPEDSWKRLESKDLKAIAAIVDQFAEIDSMEAADAFYKAIAEHAVLLHTTLTEKPKKQPRAMIGTSGALPTDIEYLEYVKNHINSFKRGLADAQAALAAQKRPDLKGEIAAAQQQLREYEERNRQWAAEDAAKKRAAEEREARLRAESEAAVERLRAEEAAQAAAAKKRAIEAMETALEEEAARVSGLGLGQAIDELHLEASQKAVAAAENAVRQRQANEAATRIEAATRGFLARKAQAREAAAERERRAQIEESARAVMQDVVALVAARLESAAATHVVEEVAQQGEVAAAATQESGEKEQPQESITDWVESFRSWAPEERDEVDRKAVNKKAAALRAARSHYVHPRVGFTDKFGGLLEEVHIVEPTTEPSHESTSESTSQSGTQPATPRWSASMRGTVGGAGVLAALLLMAPELFSSKQRKKFGAIFSRNTKNKNTKTRLSSAQIGALVRVVAALAIGGVSATMAARGRPDFWTRV